MSDWWDDNKGLVYVSLILGVILGGITLGAVSDFRRSSRLMEQCIQDGRKEYECASMLRSNTQVVPVIVPR